MTNPHNHAPPSTVGPNALKISELIHERPDHGLAELQQDGVAELTPNVGAGAVDLEVVGEGHEPEHLVDAEASCSLLAGGGVEVLPVGGSDPRSGLRLERGRGSVGVKAQQECPVASTDDEHPAAQLRDSVVRGEQHLPLGTVAELAQSLEEPIELSFVGLMREALHVLQDERLGAWLADNADVLVYHGGVEVAALALLLKPEPGLAERGSWWTADDQHGLFGP